MDATAINESLHGTLAALLGLRFVEASADTVGAAATILTLPPGAGTTTLESKQTQMVLAMVLA